MLEALENEVEQGQVTVSIRGEEVVVEIVEASNDSSAADESMAKAGAFLNKP